MDVKKAIVELMDGDVFKAWHADNPGAKAVHFFAFYEQNFMKDCQVGFYDNDKDVMNTFIISKDNVEITPEPEIFREKKHEIKELSLDKIKTTTDQVLEILNKLMKEKYKSEIADKLFFVLQNIDEGQVWNLTTITKSFNTLNVKIDSESGKIIDDRLMSVFEFKK